MSNFKIKFSLFLNFFVFAILLNSVGIVILLVQKSFAVTKSGAAILDPFKDVSAVIISFIVTSSLIKIGYKKVMLMVLGCMAIVCFSMPFTSSFLAIKLLFAAVGSGFAVLKMAVFGTIGLICNNEIEHIRFMNFLEACFGAGIVTAYFIFARFINVADPSNISWLNVYFLLGSMVILAFLLLLISPLDESAAKGSSVNKTISMAALFRLAAKPIVLLFVCCAFFYVLLEQSVMNWLPTFNNNVLKLNESLSIKMASILAASIAAGRFLSGLLLKKMHWLTLLSSCLALSALILILLLPATQNFIDTYIGVQITSIANVPLVAFIFPLIGLMLAPVYPVINSVILSSLPKPQHGLMSGLIIIFSALGSSVGAIITGIIFQCHGGQAAYYFALVPIVLLVVLLFMFRKQHDKIAKQLVG
ncbi:MAG: MFS transporter [Sphingobacteriales bacterium]|nr:MFS transporter [Sphingobacteriales bacterium]